MFPFERPTNYGEMLNKIGVFTFIEAFGLTCLVADFVPSVASLLHSIQVPIKFDPLDLDVPFLYVAPAALVAVLARIILLHDKLSDLFRVRRTFDLYRILMPLAGAVGYAISPALREKLKENREDAMERTYYKYASFEEPAISKALVLSAIDTWTWYWVLAEFLFLLVSTAAVLLLFGAYKPAAFTLTALFVATVLFCSVFPVCGAKADHQIQEIVSDPARAAALKQEFSSLLK